MINNLINELYTFIGRIPIEYSWIENIGIILIISILIINIWRLCKW